MKRLVSAAAHELILEDIYGMCVERKVAQLSRNVVLSDDTEIIVADLPIY